MPHNREQPLISQRLYGFVQSLSKSLGLNLRQDVESGGGVLAIID